MISTVFRSDRPDLSNSISGTLEIPLGQTNCTWQVRNHMNLSIPLSLQSKHLHKKYQPSFEKNDAPNGLKKTLKNPLQNSQPSCVKHSIRDHPPAVAAMWQPASHGWRMGWKMWKQHFLGHFCRTSDLELQDWGCRLQGCYSMGLPLKMYKSRFTNHLHGRVVKSWYPSEALPIHRSTKLVLSTIVCRNLYS